MSLPVHTGTVTGLSAKAPNSAWAVDSYGGAFKYDGTGWIRMFQTPNNLGLTGVYETADGTVWAGGEAGLYTCQAPCQGLFVPATLTSHTCTSIAA